MIRFAQYIQGNLESLGFEIGRLYPIEGSIRGVELQEAHFIINEKCVSIPYPDSRFRFFKKAYAVWDGCGPPLFRRAGEVVAIDDFSNGFFKTVGNGFLSSKHLRLVGTDILSVGMSLMCKKDGRWTSVSAISENLDFSVGSGKLFYPPTKFVFPVRDGCFLKNPKVVCVDSFLNGTIHEGDSYVLRKGLPGGMGTVTILVDGVSVSFLANRFRFLT